MAKKVQRKHAIPPKDVAQANNVAATNGRGKLSDPASNTVSKHGEGSTKPTISGPHQVIASDPVKPSIESINVSQTQQLKKGIETNSGSKRKEELTRKSKEQFPAAKTVTRTWRESIKDFLRG